MSLADPGGAPPARARPTGSNSLIFAYIFAKKHPRQKSAPPQQLGAPPTGNPGSATECDTKMACSLYDKSRFKL